MITLDSTTLSLEIDLAGTVTANQLPVVTTYVDHTATTYTPISNNTQTNNTTAVSIVDAPAASTQRQVKSITVYNEDTAAATVTIQLNDNATLRTIVKTALAIGDTLQYNDGEGWKVTDSSGAIRTTLSTDSFAIIQVDGTPVSTSTPTLDFDGTDFTLTESPTDDFDITINAERIQDISGAMFTGNTETLITATYQDADGTIDLVVDNDLNNYDNTNSAFLKNVVEDLTPQLGGDLDVNGQTITSASAGNVNIKPNGAGVLNLDAGAGGVSITTDAGNSDITLNPHGTGNINIGNYTFDGDQTVGAGQDNYVLTYDNASGLISLEAAAGGVGNHTLDGSEHTDVAAMTEALGDLLYWDSTQWNNLAIGAEGEVLTVSAGNLTWSAASAGDFDAVYDASVSATNLTMEIDNGTLAFQTSSGNDFNIEDSSNTSYLYFTEFSSQPEIGIGQSIIGSAGLMQIGGNRNHSPSTAGAYIDMQAVTATDDATIASGTATNFAFNSIAQPTLAATNLSVTTTNAATFYIADAPANGTNNTITNPYALWVDAGVSRFDGNVGIGTATPISQLTVDGNRGIYQRDTTGGRIVFDDSDVADGSTPMAWIGGIGGELIFYNANRNASTGLTTGSTETMRIDTNGNVGIGTTIPSWRFHSDDGAGEFFHTGAGAYIENTGTDDSFFVLRRAAANKWAIMNDYSNSDTFAISKGGISDQKFVIDASGNVGIGTASPDDPLHVLTNVSGVAATFENDTTFVQVDLDAAAASDSAIVFKQAGTQVSKIGYDHSASAFVIVPDSGSFATADFAVTSAGNVGIGTTSPTGSLDIVDPITGSASHQYTQGITTTITGTNSYNSIGRGVEGLYLNYQNSASTTTNTSGIYILPQFVTSGMHTNVAGIQLYPGYSYAGNTVSVTNAKGIHLKSWGNVAPSTFTNQYGLFIENITGATNNWAIYSEGGDNYFAGNVGIGTTTPDYKLEIEDATNPSVEVKDTTNNVQTKMQSTDNTGLVGTRSNHDFYFATNNTERMRIDTSGNVGIGDATPDEKLDVAGNTISDLYKIQSGGQADHTVYTSGGDTTTVNNTTTETTLMPTGDGSLTIAAAQLVAGRKICLRAEGLCSRTSGSCDLTYSWFSGGGSSTTLSNSADAVTDVNWVLEAELTFSSATAAVVTGRWWYYDSSGNMKGSGEGATGVATGGADVVIDLTADFSIANVNNSFTLRSSHVTIKGV